ncbi:MAG: hypothetical protein LAT57_11685, partial [Balneolales bacterium]|nr:hypothetical protein [Balneolales bacterium]
MGENQSSFIAHLRDQSDGLRTRLTSGDITIQDIQDFMHVTAVMWNPEYFETEKQENEAVIVALFDSIKNRVQNEVGKLSFSREEELIVDLFFKYMLKEDLYSGSRSAAELINRSANTRVELSAHWIGFFYAEQSGELEQAINHLDRVMELERKHGVSETILSDMYDMYSSL